jgi:lysophospholipase L1-like esterase
MQQRPSRWLALGDSYTVGEGVPWSASWPARLALRLSAEDVAVAEPRVIARTGWTCEELLVALRSELRELEASAPWDLVTLLVGVNDQYRGRATAAWLPSYVVLLEEALRLAGDRPAQLLAVSVPDWGVTPFAHDRDPAAIAAAIDVVNRAQRRAAVATGARWLDVTELGRERRGPSWVASDGLHPSEAMYRLWVERMLPVVRQILV